MWYLMPAHAQPTASFGLRRPFSFLQSPDDIEGPRPPKGWSIFPMNIYLNFFFRSEDLLMDLLSAYRIGMVSP